MIPNQYTLKLIRSACVLKTKIKYTRLAAKMKQKLAINNRQELALKTLQLFIAKALQPGWGVLTNHHRHKYHCPH